MRIHRLIKLFFYLSLISIIYFILPIKVEAVSTTIMQPIIIHLPSPGDTVDVQATFDNILIGSNQKFVEE